MDHLYIIYYFITFSTGLICLAGTIQTYFHKKKSLTLHYILFFSLFSFYIIIKLLYQYVLLNFNIDNWATKFFLGLLNDIFFFGTVLAGLFFCHSLNRVTAGVKKNIIFSVFFLLVFIYNLIMLYRDDFSLIANIIINSPVVIALLYIVITQFYYYRKLEGRSKRFSLHINIILLILFPSLILDIIYTPILKKFFKLDFSFFLIFPLYYSAMGIIGYLNLKEKPDKGAPPAVPVLTDDLITAYEISPREADVIRVLLEGKSNKQISEVLFISIPTVKKHIYNIFRKLEVSSRFELIQFLTKHKNQ